MEYFNDYDGEKIAKFDGFCAVFLYGSWVGCDWFNNGTRQELGECHDNPYDAIKQAREVYT